MKNKALFVFPTAILGGAERVMFNLIYYLLNKNFHITVYIMSRGKQSGWEKIENHPNINIIIKDYPSEKTSLIPFLKDIFRISRKDNFKYTFSSHTHINALISFLKKIHFFKSEFIISRESTFIFERFFGLWRIIFKLIYRFMYGKQNLIICQTERMKASLISNLGYKPAKTIEVIPNPVNLDYIDEQLSSSELARKPFPVLIVGCGRLIPLKKFDYLIKAFSRLEREFPRVGLVIIGNGPERENLDKLVKKLNIQNKVIFTEKISNPIQWFAKADIGVISSEIEGFPNVLIEMMASGTKQVITTPCTDGVNHIPHISITESCSVQAIEKSIHNYLCNPIDMSTENQRYIRDNRSVEAFWQKVEEYIK